MGVHGDPGKVAMDQSGANKAAIDAINAGRDVPILVRPVTHLITIVEHDHQAVKRVTRPMLNFKSFRFAGCVLAGIELRHLLRKGQFAVDDASPMSFADQFYALTGHARPVYAGVVFSMKKIRAASTTRQNRPLQALPLGSHPIPSNAIFVNHHRYFAPMQKVIQMSDAFPCRHTKELVLRRNWPRKQDCEGIYCAQRLLQCLT